MAKVKLKVPKLSGFDKSFQNLLTTSVGTLTPILTDEVIPNTKVHLKTAINASLPPLASDTFMRCNLKLEAFFVPSRLLYGGYVSWLTGEQIYSQTDGEFVQAILPHAIARTDMVDENGQNLLRAGGLADFLGVRTLVPASGKTERVPLNIFHFSAIIVYTMTGTDIVPFRFRFSAL